MLSLLLLGLLLTGCLSTKVTGGGWTDLKVCQKSESGLLANSNGRCKLDEVRATFGFQFKCDPVVSGQLQYNDHDGVRIHGVADSSHHSICTDFVNSGVYEGDYTLQGKKGPGGTFVVKVEDAGEPGASSGDYFSIKLCNGDSCETDTPWYSAEGTLGGGNIQAH